MRPLILLVLLSFPLFAQTTGTVVGVTDGDTIAVLTPAKKQIKVRLAGIDAPEKGQPYAAAAKGYLSLQVLKETVRLEGGKVDRYGRLVAKLLLHGEDVNLRMIDNGLAWHYKKYAPEQSEQDRIIYALSEIGARKAKLNLWRDRSATPPWEYRVSQTETEKSAPNPPYALVPSPVHSPKVDVIIGNRKT